MALPGFSNIIVSLNQSRLNSDEKSDPSDEDLEDIFRKELTRIGVYMTILAS